MKKSGAKSTKNERTRRRPTKPPKYAEIASPDEAAAFVEQQKQQSAQEPAGVVIGRPWKPGESGNPAGRSRDAKLLTQAFLRQLEKVEPKTRKTYLDLFAEGVLLAAIKGDSGMARLVLERVEGKVAEVVQVQGALTHVYVSIDDDDAKRIMQAYLGRSSSDDAARRVEATSVEIEAGLRVTRSNGNGKPS